MAHCPHLRHCFSSLYLPPSFQSWEESWHLSPCAPIEQSGWRMSEQEMISVAFITPICLLTLTSLVLVARIGVKAAVTRAFELEDGKQTRQRERERALHAQAPPVNGTSSDHISIWGPPIGASPAIHGELWGGWKRAVLQAIMCTMILRNTRLICS